MLAVRGDSMIYSVFSKIDVLMQGRAAYLIIVSICLSLTLIYVNIVSPNSLWLNRGMIIQESIVNDVMISLNTS